MKTLARFNYWEFPAINPLLDNAATRTPPVLAPTYLGDYFRSRFTAGEEDAIFEFALQDKTALRRRWVVVVLETWQREGAPETGEKVLRVIRQFLQPPPPSGNISISRIIAADQAAFADMANLRHNLQFPLGEAARLVAQRLEWPEAMAAEVYRQYLEAVATFFPPDLAGRFPLPEILDWLARCLENLRKL